MRTIDVLSISGGRITAIEVVPGNLGLATQLGAVALVQSSSSGGTVATLERRRADQGGVLRD